MRWTVLVPIKSLPEAKSRLAAASSDPAAHRDLVQAIRADTLAAVAGADGVTRTVLVADRDVPAEENLAGRMVFVQSAPGLNAALAEAAADAARRWPGDAVAALVGDLPALRPEELAAALRTAATLERAFVPDAAGVGTTLLAAAPGQPLRPQFGAGSAARHGRDAAALNAGPGLRCDVDTEAELRAARALGLGPRTSALLAELAS